MEGLREFLAAGGPLPGLVVSGVALVLGSFFLVASSLARAVIEIVENTRLLATRSREGPSYLGLRALGLATLLLALAVYLVGLAGGIYLVVRGDSS